MSSITRGRLMKPEWLGKPVWLLTEGHLSGWRDTCMHFQVTFEAPPGVKRNLQRTYDAWPAEYLQAGSPLRAQLLFVLAWFHAVVQERRTYIPQVRA
jgi:dynein heavy chain 2, cytosolic